MHPSSRPQNSAVEFLLYCITKFETYHTQAGWPSDYPDWTSKGSLTFLSFIPLPLISSYIDHYSPNTPHTVMSIMSFVQCTSQPCSLPSLHKIELLQSRDCPGVKKVIARVISHIDWQSLDLGRCTWVIRTRLWPCSYCSRISLPPPKVYYPGTVSVVSNTS